MQARLKRFYCCLLLPPLVIIAALLGARSLQLIEPVRLAHARAVAQAIFILSIVLAVAMPVVLRTLFANRMRAATRTPWHALFRLQRQLIAVALLTPYLSLIACVVELPSFYHAGVVLAALYAIYYQFPSARRIDFDCRIFRVEYGADD